MSIRSYVRTSLSASCMIEKMVKSRSKVADLEISGIGQKAGLWRIENRSKGEKGISGDMGKRSRSGDLRNRVKLVRKQGSLARNPGKWRK